MLFAGFGRGHGDLNEFYEPEYIVGRVLEDLRRGETIVDAPTGPVQVYLPPEVLPMFVYPVVLGLNGRSVAKGGSPLKGRLGEQVFDPGITVLDNPHRDYYQAHAIDADGVPTRKTMLIENGVVKTFLYDLDTAGLAGTEPTGHDGCSPWCLEGTPGDTSSDELLAAVADGIYVKSLLGFGQSNIMNGDFSSNVGLGFRIRDGKIVGRIKNTMIAGNVYEMLARNVRVSSDVDPVTRAPHMVLEGVTASAARS
jgi:PmbA protein